MSDDPELMAVSRLTRILIDLRTDSGDRVAERALAYAAARAGIDLPIIRLAPRPARKATAPPPAPEPEPAPPAAPTPDHTPESASIACPACDRTFATAHALEVHQGMAHTTPARHGRAALVSGTHVPVKETRGRNYPRPCPYCGRTILSGGGWSKHVRVAHPDKPRDFPEESSTQDALPDRATPATPIAEQLTSPDPAPDPAPLPFEDRPVRYDCPHCGREFVTKASRDGHMSHCPARAPVAAPEPVVMIGEPPHPGTLDYLWRKSWPRPCPECWKQGSRWEAAGPRAMADHRFHSHGVPMDAGHRLHQSLAAAPAAPSKDREGWSCASCGSAAFARSGESDVCMRCAARALAVHARVS